MGNQSLAGLFRRILKSFVTPLEKLGILKLMKQSNSLCKQRKSLQRPPLKACLFLRKHHVTDSVRSTVYITIV